MKAETIAQLPPKVRREAWNRLERAGLKPDQVIALLGSTDAEAKNVVHGFPMLHPCYAYDAVSIFGFGEIAGGPMPVPKANGEVVVRYGGWSLTELFNSEVGLELMHRKFAHYLQDYTDLDWSNECLDAGIYSLRLPIPGSNRKTMDQQAPMFLPSERRTHVVLAVTALLAHYVQTGLSLLGEERNSIICAQTWRPALHATVDWFDSKLHVRAGAAGFQTSESLWASGVRKIS